MGREEFFPRKDFHEGTNFGGKIYGGIVLHGETNDQTMQRGAEFHKIHFTVI